MPPDGPQCRTCPYAPEGIRFLPPDGSGSSGIMLVGDSGWKDEQAQGRVFAGAAGKLLDRILALLPGGGLRRGDLTIWNTIACSPPRLNWMDNAHRIREAAAAIEHCRPHLDELIVQRKPRVIVPMGNVALRRVCGVSGIEEHAGYILSSPYSIPCVPTFHPSFVMRGKFNLIPVVLWALTRASQIAQGSFHATTYDLLIDPHPDALRAYVQSAGARIATLFVDIETPESSHLDEEDLEEKGPSYTIVRAGFSIRKGTACSFPWVEPYVTIMRSALERADEVVEWADNHYDTKRLRAAGMPIPNRVISGMWAWHWLQSDLPKGLGKVAPFWYAGPPWKHLNVADPGYYNGLDNSIGLDCFIGTREALVAQGRWASFERHCVAIDPILIDMGRRGLRIDREYQTAFMAQLEAEWDVENAKVQALVPQEVKPRKYWKRPPKDMTGVVPIDKPIPGASGELQWVISNELQDLIADVEQKKKSKRPVLPYQYMRIGEFNVDSWPQIVTLAKHLGIRLPSRESTTGEEAFDTSQKVLKKFAKQYPVFGHIHECRKRWKMVSTYKWKLDAEDRAHYTLGFHPSTWRLSCRSVNMQTIPKRSDLAKSFRRMIVASPGHKLIEGDAAAIEGVIVGHLAGSARYVRLAKAGVHGWLTAALHGVPISLDQSDDALSVACRASKKKWPDDYEKCKRIVHGSNYIMGPRRIHEEYPEEFVTERDARQLQDFYFSTEAGKDVRAWQKRTVEIAHANKALENRFGLRHRFYVLYSWNPRRQAFDLGDDAKRAVAFVPQSAAAAIQRLVVHRLLELVPEARQWLCLLVHDAIIADVPDERVDEYCRALYQAMTAPVDELEGLAIGTSISIGGNLAPYAAEDVYKDGLLVEVQNLAGMMEWVYH